MIRVTIVGLGAIGRSCARAVLAESGMELVGAVDTDPAQVGRGLASLLESQDEGFGASTDLEVTGDLGSALANTDVAVVTTRSDLSSVAPILCEAIAKKVAVVSSCEQMSWPWYAHPDLARQLDAEAREAGCALLGTGVNPGFVMDTLAVVLASVARRVTRVRCVRRIDASVRRAALQEKLGIGLEPEAFRERLERGDIGHVGLPESIALTAAGLGHQVAPGEVELTLEPVLAEEPTPWAGGQLKPGRVAGVHHLARWAHRGLKIEMDLTMAAGVRKPLDKICIQGPVPLCLKIDGAVPGDSATVAVLLNHIPRVRSAPPGLRTMLDIPPSGCCNHDRAQAATSNS
ncbi:MAG: dihydrodipicolinate reductase [Phycisphaeraceae bacterium]